MENFGIQVLVRNNVTNADEWRWLRPTGGKPYQYTERQKADEMRDMCYPDEPRSTVRVASFNDYPA